MLPELPLHTENAFFTFSGQFRLHFTLNVEDDFFLPSSMFSLIHIRVRGAARANCKVFFGNFVHFWATQITTLHSSWLTMIFFLRLTWPEISSILLRSGQKFELNFFTTAGQVQLTWSWPFFDLFELFDLNYSLN
jgi:hypothetical protein